MIINKNYCEFKKAETKLCDRIRELCDTINLLSKEGTDLAETSKQLEETLKELTMLKERFRNGS